MATGNDFMWARADRTVTDWWECEACRTATPRDIADDSGAINHAIETGHITVLCHESRQVIYPLSTG